MFKFKWFVQAFLIVLSLAVGVVILGYLLSITDASELSDNLLDFGLLPFLGFVGIFVLTFICSSMRWQLIINQHMPRGKRIGLARVFMDRLAGFSASYLTPAAQVGGEPVRIALLSTGSVSIPVKQATSSVVLDIAFELAALFAFVIMGIALAVYQGLGDGNSFLVLAVTLTVFLLGLSMFFYLVATGRGVTNRVFKRLPWKSATRWERWRKSFSETEDMMTHFLREDKLLVAKVMFLSMMVFGFRVVDAFFLMHFFGIDITFSQAFLIATLPAVALVMPVPGSVGVLEGGYAAIFALLGIPVGAVAYVLLVRARDFLFILLGLMRIISKGREFVGEKILRLLER